MKKLSTIVAIAVLFLSACNNNSVKEETTEVLDDIAEVAPPAPKLVHVAMIVHTVKDFDKWKTAYDAHDSMRSTYGISSLVLGRGMDNKNEVIIIHKLDDLAKAKAFSASPDLKEAMQKAGVTSEPRFEYMEVVRMDTAASDAKDRCFVKHRVKDFDVWMKAYEAEGAETRAAHGFVERGIGRSTEDPNVVYIAFTVTDLKKAKARGASPELKNIMTEGGVEGAPTINYFTAVQ